MSEETKKIAEKARKILEEDKSGAMWAGMLDLNDALNYSDMARTYFGKSANWLLQRLHGYEVNGKPARFKPEEYKILSDALRDIAAKALRAADAIDNAKL
ncbi:hypothetical protein PC1C4_28940 [Paraprevotella clara]|uniref:DUF5053 domain-containing protein n=1 Tax=Paraprevotella clara TaxID=454154 RepID=UPI002492C567|nr:DUF5053 domain-containing protein [Paraprevotella clara]BDI76172.1 hypothetical protein PC1C4_28940 [Paraprevotella clara]